MIGDTSRQYSVHLDLLCKDSGYFREVLQSNRKEIQGVCSICHEDLQPAVEDIIYCRAQCGVNFHLPCMQNWQLQSPKPLKCPHCRQKWNNSMHRQSLPDVDASIFEMYIEWLYHARIRTSPPGEGDCFGELIQAYEMGILFENQDFCIAILHAIVEVIEEDDAYPSPADVAMAYGFPDEEYSLRELLVDVYMRMFGTEQRIWDLWDDLPYAFLQDLMQAFIDNAPVKDKTETMEALRSNLPPRVPSDESADGS